jgi:fumarylacetoacetate (FAA) hydrolase family protein
MALRLDASECLPVDGLAGTLVGRAWVPGNPAGPAVVVATQEGVFDISQAAATTAQLFNGDDPLAAIGKARRDKRLGSVEELIKNSAFDGRDASKPYLIAPLDLQAVKAAGVTFARSMLERVVEEQAKGDPSRAAGIRAALVQEIGSDLGAIKPGSPQAMKLKESLIKRSMWSQYLEVGIGPDAEIFTKCQPMASVGLGAEIGLNPGSTWNNPEPEIVVVVNARGTIVGATLGNDVNLRDYEGRSALLLSKAKDNNGSCAIGPFIRMFDSTFGINDVRKAEIELTVAGQDQFRLNGRSSMSQISRDPTDLVGQAINACHQYPDGFGLFMGTMFAPTEDRDTKGSGFTHKVGDVVTIRSEKLGALVNQVNLSDKIPAWNFGALALISNLAARKLI